MKIKILYFGGLKEALKKNEDTLIVNENTKSQELLDQLYKDLPALEKWRGKLLLAVNQEHIRENVTLSDGDEMALMPPLAGG